MTMFVIRIRPCILRFLGIPVFEVLQTTRASMSDDMARSAADAVNFLKCLAHEQRLMILCHLCFGEKSVGELMEQIGVSQSATSQMLARLREDGLVKSRRDGKKVYYRLATVDAGRVVTLIHRLFCEEPPSADDPQDRLMSYGSRKR